MDWASCMKPLLAGSANNFSAADLAKLSRTIFNCRDELLNHNDEFSPFYSRFVALSAHFLCANYNMGKVELANVQAACNVLIEFLAQKLLKPDVAGEHVTHGQLVLIIKSLTTGSGCLFRPDVISLITKLKSSNLPPHIRNSIRDKIEEDASNSPVHTSDSKKVVGALAPIFDTLSSPLIEYETEGNKSKKDAKDYFVNENIKTLIKWDVGSKLIEVCLWLPHLGKCIKERLPLVLQASYKKLGDISFNITEVNCDLDVVSAILELPLIIHSRANPAKMCDIALGSLVLASESVQCRMNPSDDSETDAANQDSMAYNILQSAMVSILIPVKNALNSLGASGLTICENMRAMSCICLTWACVNLLDKYGAKLVVSDFVDQLLTNIAPILKDAKADPCTKTDVVEKLDVDFACTSAQRFMYVDERTSIVFALLKIGLALFTAGTEIGENHAEMDSSLERIDGDMPPPLLIDVSARQTPPNEFVSATPDTSADSTDETLLGNWLEELFASVPQLADGSKQQLAKTLSRRKSTVEGFTGPLRDAQPPSFKLLGQSVECIRTLNSALLSGPPMAPIMHKHLSDAIALKESLSTIALLINRLDMCPPLNGHEKEMSLEVSKLMHNLLVNSLLNDSTQDSLIELLMGCNLSLGKSWPLHVSPRCLAVLGQILLLRINRKQDDASRVKAETTVMSVWSRFIAAVQDNINNSLSDNDTDLERIVNVEHVQLLLVLFHSLSLLSKKSLFLQVAESVATIANMISQPKNCKICLELSMNTCCMLLVFEYIIKQFYEPAPTLVEHVKHNIFTVDSLVSNTGKQASNRMGSPACHVFAELNDICKALPRRYRGFTFFNLFPQVWSESEMPKLDGLAINFLLASPNFPILYTSLVNLFSAEVFSHPFASKVKEVPDQLLCCCLSYLRLTLWRVLGQLPFSAQYLKNVLASSSKLQVQDAFNMLRFGSRLQSVEYKQWINDMLIKQDMNQQDANNLVKDCAEIFVYPISSIQTIIWQHKDFSLMGLLQLHLCLLRLRWLLASRSKLFSDNTLTPEELGALQAVMGVIDKLKEAAIKSVHEEAERDCDDNDVPPIELTRMLLSLGQPAPSVTTLVEARALYTSFSSWAPHRITRAVELWRNSERVFTHDQMINVPGFVEEEANAEEVFLAEVHWNHMLSLADKYVCAALTVSRRCWETALRLVLDVLQNNKTEIDWPQMDLDSIFLPHIFCILANPAISDKIHSVLNQPNRTPGKHTIDQRVRFEKENGYFIAKCFEFILNHCNYMYEMPITTVSYVVSKLTECIQRPQTWPAWAKYLKDADLSAKLCRLNDAGKCPTLGIMTWIELLLAIIEKSEDVSCREKSDLRVQDMELVEEALLRPMLQYQVLVKKWASNFGEVALDPLLAEIRELNVASLRPDRFIVFVEAVCRYLTKHQDAKWSVTASGVFLEAIVEVLNSVLIKPVSPFFNVDSECVLRMSDRWMDSTLEMINLPASSKPAPAVLDTCFNRLLPLAIKFADVAGGLGHVSLLNAANNWLDTCKSHLQDHKNVEALEASAGPLSRNECATLALAVDSCTSAIGYIKCLVRALLPTPFEQETIMPNRSSEIPFYEVGAQLDEQTGGDDEDSGGEDSGDEQLDCRLCTFVVTAKEFMNQHWYHCHTCGLVEGEGVCSVCAKVCHKDHDMSYSKFGSFFCDCGAKANGCLALVKRTERQMPGANSEQLFSKAPSGFDGNRHPALTKIASFPSASSANMSPRLTSMLQVLEFTRYFTVTHSFADEAKRQLIETLQKDELQNKLGALLDLLTLPISRGAELRSTSGALERRRRAQDHYKHGPHQIDPPMLLMEHCAQLPENTVENVKLSLSGEQAQTLKQVLQSHSVDRKVMVATTLPDNKRQLLVVAVDKCKIFVFNAQTMLKQMTSIPRCGYDTLNFTIVSMSAMEDCIAVCGLKECQLLCLSPHGSIVDRIAVNLKLEGHNYIIKTVWCGDTRGLLAVITADFTNVYDLTTDVKQPLFQFEPPVGKIRDAVFACWEEKNSTGKRIIDRNLLMMSSLGYVYLQGLNQDCLYSQHGAFFVTSMLHIEDQQTSESTICGGGVSIYYSHLLQQIFLSYANGTTLFGHLDNPRVSKLDQLTSIFQKSSSDGKDQALCNWTEMPEHPGVLLASKQMAGNPYVFYFGPSKLQIQELGNMSKAKVLDSVLLTSGRLNTLSHRLHTLVLCEDGSMQLLVEGSSQALDWWLDSPAQFLCPPLNNPFSKMSANARKRKLRAGSGPVNFPVDFFETCQQIQDLEFGGKDMLHIYNVQQLKNRLNTSSLYIVSMKAGGFTLEVTSKETGILACGVRIELGKHNLESSPSYVSVFGRRKEINLTRPRWFDIPFTKDEALLASNKFNIQFGPSSDGSGKVFVDSVRVYGRSKEGPGWVQDGDISKPPTGKEVDSNRSSEDRGLMDVNSPCLRQPFPPEVLSMTLFDALATFQTAFKKISFDPTENVERILVSNVHLSTIQMAKAVMRKKFDSTEEYYVQKDLVLMRTAANLMHNSVLKEDPEVFAFALMLLRNVAVFRPQNMIKHFSDGLQCEGRLYSSMYSFLVDLMDIFWKIHRLLPAYPKVQPVSNPSAIEIGACVRSIVEIVHCYCFSNPPSNSAHASEIYAQLLLSEDVQMSQACKLTLNLIYRLNHKGGKGGESDATRPHVQHAPPHMSPSINVTHDDEATVNDSEDGMPYDIEVDESNLEDLLAAANGDVLVDLVPPDVDDEAAMVELAIALSLQQEESDDPSVPVDTGDTGDDDTGQLSDTSASGMSDEEGSNAATEGSTLRLSPVEDRLPQPTLSNPPSESGASAAESASGPSSVYGGEASASRVSNDINNQPNLDTNVNIAETEDDRSKMHQLQLNLLEHLIGVFGELNQVHDGMRCVAFMQTMLMLTSDLDTENERDKQIVHRLVEAVLQDLQLQDYDPESLVVRTKCGELQLLKLRLLSVLLQKIKTRSKAIPPSCLYIASHTARSIMQAGAMSFCKTTLQSLLPYWKAVTEDKSEDNRVLSPRSKWWWIDLSPFFLSQFVQEHGRDIFESYVQLITEMALRLPYQMRKVQDVNPAIPKIPFDQDWEKLLCELVSCQEAAFVRRQARKLLLLIAGSKDNYRLIRDQYSVMGHLSAIRHLCSLSPGQTIDIDCINRPLNLTYSNLNVLMDHLKVISDLASVRVGNWQKLCAKTDTSHCNSILVILMRLACVVNDVLSQVVLDLLQAAICQSEASVSNANGKIRRKKEEEGTSRSARFSNNAALNLSRSLIMEARKPLMVTFMHRFLLRCNVAERRTQAHALLLSLFQNVLADQQAQILDILWADLWPQAVNHGAKAAQLVDLIAYFTMQLKGHKELQCLTEGMLKSLKQGLQDLAAHPNSNLYSVLGNLLDTDGYFLEDNPCLVCNNPEVPMANVKLSSVKLDSRFTTSSQIVKMTASHEISKISVKLTEVKRKMIKQMNVYYSNKSVQSAVDLKNKPELWLLAKKVNLSPNQTEVKLEFPVPIVACNMMIEFTSFYDKNKNVSELVHCPRCSASVPANPGVCANCGENVFQCHKCRAINYDEKDPFLCNSCGFSKYAKFEITLNARQVASVEPIQNEEDRNKTLAHINSLLENADQTHNKLLIFRLQLERVVKKLNVISPKIPVTSSTAGVVNLGVNSEIQQLALMYSRDCKISFEELSRLLQRVLANRAELLQYDSRLGEQVPQAAAQCLVFAQSNGRCYGCMTAQACNCVKLVRALCTDPNVRQTVTGNKQLLEELAHAFSTLPTPLALLMKDLLCELNRDSNEATNYMCQMIKDRVLRAISDSSNTAVLTSMVEHELQLLRSLVDIQDGLWETRIKCVYQIFLSSLKQQNRMVMEYVTAPCLAMLHWLSDDTNAPDKATDSESTKSTNVSYPVDLSAWILDDPKASFAAWKYRVDKMATEQIDKKEARQFYLMNKYGRRWLKKCAKGGGNVGGSIKVDGWLQTALFYPNSVHMRMSAAAIFKRLCANSPDRKAALLDILATYANKMSILGEKTAEYVSLFKSLLNEDHWKFYLALKGFLPKLGFLITTEVERLNCQELEGVGTDVSQGYAIKILAEFLQDFLSVEAIGKRWKGELVGCVLHGYLALRRLVLQRTKMVDEAEGRLLALLEDLTTGTEKDTKEFMGVCIETVNKYSEDDLKAPVFIFERLCSIIFPEEKEVGEFFVNIEKDTAQEDFLQGRMMANPYSSNDLGKLMKDVKNRICRDCELIALLEDDTGMELLVNNKIISLELPLAEVYKKLWKPENDGEAMLIVYRMRGLLGDATEEFIQTLDSNKDAPVDDEEVFRLAEVMATNGGLEALLFRLRCIRNLLLGRPLLNVILKLFSYCVKLKKNRLILLKPEMNTMPALVAALKLVVVSDETPQLHMAEAILSIIRELLEEAKRIPPELFKGFSKTCGSAGDIVWLLQLAGNPQVILSPTVQSQLSHIIPNITLGSQDRMAALVDYFTPSLRFNHPEYELDLLEQRISRIDLDLLCMIVKEIQMTEHGAKLKQLFIESGVVKDATEFLIFNCPPLFKLGQTVDSPEWERFLSRPSLKDVLRILAGLCQGHEPTQKSVAKDCIAIIHRLEQISTAERLGSLAENVMEALRGNEEVAKKIEEVRKDTRKRKKQLAMAMRDKQLEDMGMKVGARGQVRVTAPKINESDQLQEESGLVCSICREGYKYQGQKVLGIYTFTKRVNAEQFELRPRKSPAYSTVTHFNVVHYDCHLQAVRSAPRGRDEWADSALLHNANVRCNGLLPLWGASVSEANFSNCLTRHHGLIQEQCGIPDISVQSAVHDLKLLLLRFANNQSFSEETKGGGKESNIHLIPCLSVIVLYMLDQSKSATNHLQAFNSFINQPPSEWTQAAYLVEGPTYFAVLAFLIVNHFTWKEKRLKLLQRLMFTAHVRHVCPDGAPSGVSDLSVKPFAVYKSMVLLFVMIDQIYAQIMHEVRCESDEEWPPAIMQYFRQNDTKSFDNCTKLLTFFEEQIYPCESFAEVCDAAGLLADINNPEEFISSALDSAPLLDLD